MKQWIIHWASHSYPHHTVASLVQKHNSNRGQCYLSWKHIISPQVETCPTDKTTGPRGEPTFSVHCLFSPWLLPCPLRAFSRLTSWVNLTKADISRISKPVLLPATEEQIYHTQMCATCSLPRATSPLPPVTITACRLVGSRNSLLISLIINSPCVIFIKAKT